MRGHEKECNIGSIYTVEIEKNYEWGCLCRQVDGYLSGAIKNPTSQFKIGQHVEVVVVGKNKLGAPYFKQRGSLINA